MLLEEPLQSDAPAAWATRWDDDPLAVPETEWIASRLRIRAKNSQVVPLYPNPAQMRLLMAWLYQEAWGEPVRMIILKARQMGFSTMSEAMMFSRVFHRPNVTGLVCAHDDESSSNLFAMTTLFRESLPRRERKRTKYSSRKEIAWAAPHRSVMKVKTAGATRLGRSDTIQYLHCSEVAFWTHQRATLTSVLQAVPDLPDTAVVLESTANGVGGEFYDRWNDAVQHQHDHSGDPHGFIPLFFSWLEHAEYRAPVPAGYDWGTMSTEELDLQDLGAVPEQLYWRRGTLRAKCGNDPAMFKQEYPATPEEAFIASGRPAIPAAILRQHRKTIIGSGRVLLNWKDPQDPKCVEVIPQPVADGHPLAWEVWREPVPRYDYTVGGDPAEGILSDPSDERSEADFSCGIVLERGELRIVAAFCGRPDVDVFGEELLKASYWYNRAWMSPEANAAGLAAVLIAKRRPYERLYRRETPDERIRIETVELVGWKTTTGNRKSLWDDWIAACRPGPDGSFDGTVISHSRLLYDHESTAVYNKNGRREHRAGCHDDMLFAAMIAWQLHLRCPRTRTAMARARRPAPVTSLARADAIDPGVG